MIFQKAEFEMKMKLGQFKKWINDACDGLEKAGFPLDEIGIELDYANDFVENTVSELDLYNIAIGSHDDADGMPYMSIELAPHDECAMED
jgi:hypothetical protein